MIRHILNNNIKSLNATESYILEYVTKTPIDWFIDQMASDNEVRLVLYANFQGYFGHAPNDGEHPFYKVWKKIVKDTNIDALIVNTHLYGKQYRKLSEQVNDLYMREYRNTILIILKAFGERDFEELADKYCFDKNLTKEEFVNDIENWSKIIADNLDELDLESIILFCGKKPFE